MEIVTPHGAPHTLVELVHKKRLKTLSRFWLQLLRYYFRIEVEGLENVPRSGRALIVPNHSGFAGADAVLLTFILKRETRRRARILAHRAFFDFSKTLKEVSESHGLRKASVSGGVDILKKDRLLILFPEGETGNFKPSIKRYRLQPFHSGFLRMAIPAQAPIVPCLIVGAEESHLNLLSLDFSKWVRNLRIPMPLNFVPLPAKWKIVFLPPIPAESWDPALPESPEPLRRETRKFQKYMQVELRKQVRARRYVYFKETRALQKKAFQMAEKLPLVGGFFRKK